MILSISNTQHYATDIGDPFEMDPRIQIYQDFFKNLCTIDYSKGQYSYVVKIKINQLSKYSKSIGLFFRYGKVGVFNTNLCLNIIFHRYF